MSFAAELKDFAAGFQSGFSMARKVRGAIDDYRDKKEFEDEKRRAEEAVDTRDARDATMPVRRASAAPPRTPLDAASNDKKSGYSTSAYGGDPYTGDDSDFANYLDDADKELAPILKVAFKDGGDWGALTYLKDKRPGGRADLENMTIDQVYALQDQMLRRGHASSAVGGFQTIKPTLQRAVEGLGLDPRSTKFDRRTQAKIAAYLARTDGGYDDYKAGRISDRQLAEKLAGVWAVLPKNASGRGAYDGVNGNRAAVDYGTVRAAITKSRAVPLGDDPEELAALGEDEDDADAY